MDQALLDFFAGLASTKGAHFGNHAVSARTFYDRAEAMMTERQRRIDASFQPHLDTEKERDDTMSKEIEHDDTEADGPRG